jgi:hypothetical protein
LVIREFETRIAIVGGVAFAVSLVMVAALTARGWAHAQAADPGFDPRVARPAYADTHPCVLFDAAHYNSHTAGGAYRPFADLLRRDGYDVRANRQPVTRSVLAPCDVLVVANALGAKGAAAVLASRVGFTSPLGWQVDAFTPDETDMIRAWVDGGGGLLLIADHAPAGAAMESLAARFGVDMSNWYAEDPRHSDPEAWSWIVFSRANGLLRRHPVVDGRDAHERVERIVTFAGQSLAGPPSSVAVLALGDEAREYPTPQAAAGEGRSAAGRAQALAASVGRGRIVVLGEAAVLSAQVFREAGRARRLGMTYPGADNRQFGLNIIHWLSRLAR